MDTFYKAAAFGRENAHPRDSQDLIASDSFHNLIGTITIGSLLSHRLSAYSLGMVISTAKAIEKEIELLQGNNLLNETIETNNEAGILANHRSCPEKPSLAFKKVHNKPASKAVDLIYVPEKSDFFTWQFFLCFDPINLQILCHLFELR